MYSQGLLKQLLKEKGISGYKLAQLLEIDNAGVYRIINGSLKNCTFWRVKELSDILGVSMEDLSK